MDGLRETMTPASDFEGDLALIAGIDAVPRILDVVCRSTGLRFAAVARVTGQRWVTCAVKDDIAFGLEPGDELQVATTICNEIRQTGERVVIDHVAEDARFCSHPTPAMYGFQSYISVPIRRRDGSFFGTLCAIDPAPAQLNRPEIVGMFDLFADLIGSHLDSQEQLVRSEAALRQELQVAGLREQFIAVLGHDLRNPLAAIQAGAEMLARAKLDEQAGKVVALVRASTDRMAGLIDDILDFAHGRLAGGLPVTLAADGRLAAMLGQVIDELRSAHPQVNIRADIAIDGRFRCDGPRLAQLLSNLLANAVTHGDTAAPIAVEARTDAAGAFSLSVTNQGPPIPPAMRDRLFEPFTRNEHKPGLQGLGLGLYIASEIARAHGGALTVESGPAGTRFSFRMPAPAG